MVSQNSINVWKKKQDPMGINVKNHMYILLGWRPLVYMEDLNCSAI